MEQLMHKIHDYWMDRADGYSNYNQAEWEDERNGNWSRLLLSMIEEAFPGRSAESLRILDAGCGPGFFSKILVNAGYRVTALDCTENMLLEAKENLGHAAHSVEFVLGDVEKTGFENLSFDVVLSRNVTWNLRHPKKAYAEWFRILESNGIMINFDANWYSYLFDEEKRKAFDEDRKNAVRQGREDCNVGEGFERMEEIARQVPLSRICRPQWDETVLQEIGFESVTADETVWERVWSEDEKISCASTPMFLVLAHKSDIKKRIKTYWNERSATFLEQRRKELHAPISERWIKEILPYVDKEKTKKVLDAGCGTGYFTILLAKLGFEVTGVDLTENMIDQARLLAKEEGADCEFRIMDAEDLDFEDGSFDLVISRNLTWTLPHPEKAYAEWMRVLKKDGILLNFDANYGAEDATDKSFLPSKHAHYMLKDTMLVENERIKAQLPVSFQKRPAWDIDTLSSLDPEKLTIDFKAGMRIYVEKDEFYNPASVFLIAVKK